MEKENAMGAWGIKICPIRNKQCMEKQCAWWREEENACAVKNIKINNDKGS